MYYEYMGTAYRFVQLLVSIQVIIITIGLIRIFKVA